MTDRDITTKLVHAGERRPLPDAQPVSTPIYASATFTYDTMQEIDQVFSGEKQGFIYTRYGNPTTAALEEAVREIEEGAFACAYATGMAAVHAALIACDLKAGSTVLASRDVYGATTGLLNNVLSNFGSRCDGRGGRGRWMTSRERRSASQPANAAFVIAAPLPRRCVRRKCPARSSASGMYAPGRPRISIGHCASSRRRS